MRVLCAQSEDVYRYASTSETTVRPNTATNNAADLPASSKKEVTFLSRPLALVRQQSIGQETCRLITLAENLAAGQEWGTVLFIDEDLLKPSGFTNRYAECREFILAWNASDQPVTFLSNSIVEGRLQPLENQR